jgi:hypothetical protein
MGEGFEIGGYWKISYSVYYSINFDQNGYLYVIITLFLTFVKYFLPLLCHLMVDLLYPCIFFSVNVEKNELHVHLKIT